MRELLPYPGAPAQDARRAALRVMLAMRRYLVRNSLDRRLLRSHGLPGKGFHHLPGTFRVSNPFGVELVRTGRDPTVAFAGIDHSGVAAVHQLEEVIFGLSVLACVADQHLRQLGVLDAVVL